MSDKDKTIQEILDEDEGYQKWLDNMDAKSRAIIEQIMEEKVMEKKEMEQVGADVL